MSQPASTRERIAPQFLRYSGAGAVGTVVQYCLLIILVQLADRSAVTASTIGAIAGALINYRLNHRYTFASRKAHGHALQRFALVSIGGIVLNALVLMAVLAFTGPHYVAAQVAATAVVLVAGFLVNRVWTF